MLGAIDLFDDPLQLPALGRPLHDDFLSEIGPPAFLTLPLGDERAYNWGLADATGALNGGITTVPGPQGWVTGQAWSMNGGTISNGAAISTSAVTFAALFSPQGSIGSPKQVLAKQAAWNSANGCGLWWGFADNTDCFFQVNGTIANTPTSTLATGGWYLLVGTYDGANVKTYVNGALLKTVALTGSIATNASSLAAIGSPFSEAFQAVWNSALTGAQVSLLYNCLRTGEPFPLFQPLATTRYFPISAGGPQSVPVPTVDVAVSAIAPTVTLGSVAPAAPTIDVVVSVIAPTISLGTVSQAAGTIDILLSVIAPAVTLGPPTIVVPTIDVAVSVVTPSIALGGVAATAGLIDISLAPIAPTVALGPVLQSAPAVAAVVDTNPPTISLGPAAAAAGIASIALDASAPAITLGSVSVAAPGLDVLIDVIAPATQVQAVPLSVVDLSLAAVASTPGFVGAYPTIDVWELSARDTVWILEP